MKIEWAHCKIPQEVAEFIDRFIESDLAKLHGIHSRSDLLTRLVVGWAQNVNKKFSLFDKEMIPTVFAKTHPPPPPPPPSSSSTPSSQTIDFIEIANKIAAINDEHVIAEFLRTLMEKIATADKKRANLEVFADSMYRNYMLDSKEWKEEKAKKRKEKESATTI